GNDLERDAGGGQRLGLLTAPAEDERIAALEPHHEASAAGVAEEEGIAVGLLEDVRPARLAREDAQGVRRRLVEEPRIDEPVVDHDVRAPEQREAAHGHEARVAGPGADERHASALEAHAGISSRARSWRRASSRRSSTISARTSDASARRHVPPSAARPAARSSRRASAASSASVAHSGPSDASR